MLHQILTSKIKICTYLTVVNSLIYWHQTLLKRRTVNIALNCFIECKGKQISMFLKAASNLISLTCLKLHQLLRALNVVTLWNWFSIAFFLSFQVTEWVVQLIISKGSQPGRRALLSCVLRLMQASWNIGNFNGVMEILLGLR